MVARLVRAQRHHNLFSSTSYTGVSCCSFSTCGTSAEQSFRLAVSHWATPKERRNGTVARPSEDAFFFSSFALGVCDGVGGWEARGVDSGMYSRGLCEGAARALHDAVVEGRLESLLPKPLLLLQAAYRHSCDQKLMGSSTALVRDATHLALLCRCALWL